MSTSFDEDDVPFQTEALVNDETEEYAPSWCSRFAGSCVGLLLGGILVLASGPVLWWNEQRYITTWRVLDESSRLVTEAPCDTAMKENFGKLLHVTCPIYAYQYAPMDSLGVAADFGTAVLERSAKIRQWEEEVKESEKEVHGQRKMIRKYSYRQIWTDRWIDSSTFLYPDECIQGSRRTSCINPSWPSDLRGSNPSKFWAGAVDAGVFRLPTELRNTIPADEDFVPPLGVYYGSEGKIYHRTTEGLSSVIPGSAPVVGDIHLSYKVNSADTVSILGAQAFSPYANATFSAYTTPKGRFFRPVLTVGEESAAEMFATLLQQNEMAAWLLRLGGWLLAWAGLGLCIHPLQLLVACVPWVGECLGDMVFCALCCVAGAMSLCTSITIISVAWLFYRPLISGTLLAICIGPVVYVIFKGCRHDERHGQPDSPRTNPWQPLPGGPIGSPSQSFRPIHPSYYGHQSSYPTVGIPTAFPVASGQQQPASIQPFPQVARIPVTYPSAGCMPGMANPFQTGDPPVQQWINSGTFSWQQQQQQHRQTDNAAGIPSAPPIV